MNCADYQELLIEAARGGEVPAHARSCAECGLFLERQRRLSASMAELRASANAAAFASCPVVISRRWPRVRYAMAAGALAAAFAGAWVLYPSRQQPPAHVATSKPLVAANVPQPPAARVSIPVRRHVRRKARPAPPAESEFISIPYTVPLGRGERAQVWRMEMPVSELMAAGFPITSRDTSSIARTDILVGDDGRARAFRLISISENNSNRSIYR